MLNRVMIIMVRVIAAFVSVGLSVAFAAEGSKPLPPGAKAEGAKDQVVASYDILGSTSQALEARNSVKKIVFISYLPTGTNDTSLKTLSSGNPIPLKLDIYFPPDHMVVLLTRENVEWRVDTLGQRKTIFVGFEALRPKKVMRTETSQVTGLYLGSAGIDSKSIGFDPVMSNAAQRSNLCAVVRRWREIFRVQPNGVSYAIVRDGKTLMASPEFVGSEISRGYSYQGETFQEMCFPGATVYPQNGGRSPAVYNPVTKRLN